jgi:RNA polymerase sigma-70 factor (sigma-E family)
MGQSRTNDEFTAFVLQTSSTLQRSALLLTGDRAAADDLVQATFTKLYVSWRKVRRAGNPVAYARTTLTRTFLSQRRLRRSGEIPTDDLPLTEVTATGSEDRLDVLAAMRMLAPTDRAVLVLRYWEDRSVHETADQLGVTETAVRTRSRRELQCLRPLIYSTQEDCS